VQRHGLFYRRTYEIVGSEIVIENSRLASGDTARYQIFDLADTTERYFERAWGWLAAAAALALFSIPFVADAIHLRAGFPLVAAALCWLGVACLWLAYLDKSYDKIVFNHWQTGKGVFVIWNNNPNKAEFERFVGALLEKIRSIRVNPKLSPEQKLDIYGRQLAFLVQENVLTAEEAKAFYERKEKAFARDKANVVSIVQGHA
jgi:hypothetical protein